MRSQAENAAMHSAAEGKSTLGIPPAVGKEFVEASKHQDISALPKRVPHRKARGGAVTGSYPPKFKW
jgi:hypothetical protein